MELSQQNRQGLCKSFMARARCISSLNRAQGVHAAACVCSVKLLIDTKFDTPASGALGERDETAPDADTGCE